MAGTGERNGITRRGILAGVCAAAIGSVTGCAATPPRNTPDGVSGARPDDSPYTEVYRQTIGSVAQVRVYDESGNGISQGSGFVFAEGFLATNNHVVEGGATYEVLFRDGEWTAASVRGTDPGNDLAVLDLDASPAYATPLPFVESEPPVGTEVVAIGAPFGLAQSVSGGIVSGQDRSLPASDISVADAVQTDAAVNPGNSGGPLLNLAGRVVGVVYAGGGENIAFAVSAELAGRVLESLVETGEFSHAFIGISLTTVTPAVARANGLDRARGVLVVDVIEGSPAAGVLRPSEERTEVRGREVPVGGDVIVAMDGEKIDDQSDLTEFLGVHGTPGETVEITVIRDGSEATVELTLARESEFDA